MMENEGRYSKFCSKMDSSLFESCNFNELKFKDKFKNFKCFIPGLGS